MKVAFLGAVPFNLIFGGGETQLLNTMAALRKLGIDVTFWDNFDRNYKCDILHIFGCHYWLFKTASLAKLKGIKLVISPISYVPSVKFYYKIWKCLDKFVPVDTTFRLHRKLLSIADLVLALNSMEMLGGYKLLSDIGIFISGAPNDTEIEFRHGKGNISKINVVTMGENIIPIIERISSMEIKHDFFEYFEELYNNTIVPYIDSIIKEKFGE